MKTQSLAKMQKLKQEVRTRILERGKIEFRTDRELLSRVLDLAAKRKIAVGGMIRQWVAERLEQETMPAPPNPLDKIEHKIDKLLSFYRKSKAKRRRVIPQ